MSHIGGIISGRMLKFFKRHMLIRSFSASLLSALAMPALALDLNDALEVKLALNEAIFIDFPDGTPQDIELELSGGCNTDSGICMTGNATIDFIVAGNSTKSNLNVFPYYLQRVQIGKRKLGVFNYQTDPTADVPKLYYDVRFELIDMELGPDGFTDAPVLNEPIMLGEISQIRNGWRKNLDLTDGPKRGRIYIQPIFDGGTTFEELNIAAPGQYTANIVLRIDDRE